MRLRPIKQELKDLEQFVRTCKEKETIEGFNVYVSKHPGKSYVLAKVYNDPRPHFYHVIHMDYADPIDRPLIVNAIHKALYGYEMDAKDMEREMVDFADDKQKPPL